MSPTCMTQLPTCTHASSLHFNFDVLMPSMWSTSGFLGLNLQPTRWVFMLLIHPDIQCKVPSCLLWHVCIASEDIWLLSMPCCAPISPSCAHSAYHCADNNSHCPNMLMIMAPPSISPLGRKCPWLSPWLWCCQHSWSICQSRQCSLGWDSNWSQVSYLLIPWPSQKGTWWYSGGVNLSLSVATQCNYLSKEKN